MMTNRKTKKKGNSIPSTLSQALQNNFPFVIFLGFLTLIVIANAQYSESQLRDIQMQKDKVLDLKREYNSLKAQLTYTTRHSQVGRDVVRLGLGIADNKPIKIKLIEK